MIATWRTTRRCPKSNLSAPRRELSQPATRPQILINPCQNFGTSVRDGHRMLKMSGWHPVDRHNGPSVRKHLNVVVTHVYHGFNGQNPTLLKGFASTRFAVIGDLRVFVHGPAYPMPAVIPHDRIPEGFDV